MYADCHVHTDFSSDSDTPLKCQIEKAISLGMKLIYITDHQDIDFPEEVYGMSFQFDTEQYLKEINKLKKLYMDKIIIRPGVELGLMTHLKDELINYTSSYDFDYTIGSVHLVRKLDPYYPEYYEGRSTRDAYMEYFETILENLKIHNCFDALGHLDYIVRYGPDKSCYPDKYYDDIIDEILRMIINKGIALECNTAGLKYGLGFPNPHQKVLKRYIELGGNMVTLGSDGHKTEHIAYAFSNIGDFLKDCGVKYQTVFKKHKPEFIPL